ncbi:MAG: helix-turn-helix domain-containing protein [Firmicutes bacterium]|nr:helix-turn-helix domain-containing protein [Bacillota bacterium]
MKIDKEKLFDHMAEKGFFIKDLCKRLNMNEPSLKRILDQEKELDDRTASKIAIVLNVKLRDIEKKGEEL